LKNDKGIVFILFSFDRTSTISSATTGLTSTGTSVLTTSINQPNSLNFGLGLGLGLGVPLLLLSALALYSCCSEKCNFLG